MVFGGGGQGGTAYHVPRSFPARSKVSNDYCSFSVSIMLETWELASFIERWWKENRILSAASHQIPNRSGGNNWGLLPPHEDIGWKYTIQGWAIQSSLALEGIPLIPKSFDFSFLVQDGHSSPKYHDVTWQHQKAGREGGISPLGLVITSTRKEKLSSSSQ